MGLLRMRARNPLVEFKVAITRVGTYVTIWNSGVLLLLLLDRFYEHFNMPYSTYILVGVSAFLVAAVVAYVVDRKFIWPGEMGVNMEVNPLTVTEAFRCARHVHELMNQGTDATEMMARLDQAFKEMGCQEEFRRFLRQMGTEPPAELPVAKPQTPLVSTSQAGSLEI